METLSYSYSSNGRSSQANYQARQEQQPEATIYVSFEDHETDEFSYYENDTVRDLKSEVYRRREYDVEEQILFYDQTQMIDDRLLTHYGVRPASTIHCLVRRSRPTVSVTRSFPVHDEFQDDGALPYELYGSDPYDQNSFVGASGAAESDYSSEPSGRSYNLPAHTPAEDDLGRSQPSQYVRPGGETPFVLLSKNETMEKMNYWWARSEATGCHPDTHIVDPTAHYSHLEHNEKTVVISSEYGRSRGQYGRGSWEDNDIPDSASEPSNIERSILGMRPEIFRQRYSTAPDLHHSCTILKNLRKTYFILCRTLMSFEKLVEARISTESWNMLIEQSREDVARLVRVTPGVLSGLKMGLENAITYIFNRAGDNTQILTEQVGVQCDLLLHDLGLPSGSHISALDRSRDTVLLLDLSLVSYAGCHANLFPSYFDSTTEIIPIGSDHPLFTCELKTLACLDEFLRGNKVWVFSPFDKTNYGKTPRVKPRPLSILTHMRDFADVWGPVSVVPVGDSQPGRVKQYNTARGCIRVESPHDLSQPICCHWYPPPSSDNSSPQCINSGIGGELSMGMDDLLIIGGILEENDSCRYTLKDYFKDYNHLLKTLGTSQSFWQLDTRTMTAGFSQQAVLTVGGTQKQHPAVTWKDSIRLGLSSVSPECTNLEFLNSYVGLLISHCSGYAIRVTLRNLLRQKVVYDRVRKIRSDWEQTAWGKVLRDALFAESPDAVRSLWKSSVRIRKSIANFIFKIMMLLEPTGRRHGCFVAAVFDHADHQMEISVQDNDWSKCLKDTITVATYAVTIDTCFRDPARDNTIVPCHKLHGETALETRIHVLDRLPSKGDNIEFGCVGEVFRVDKLRKNQITLIPAGRITRLKTKLINLVTQEEPKASEAIKQRGPSRSQRELSTLIQASRPSYGGMRVQRQISKHRPRDQSPHRYELPNQYPTIPTPMQLPPIQVPPIQIPSIQGLPSSSNPAQGNAWGQDYEESRSAPKKRKHKSRSKKRSHSGDCVIL